MTPLTFDEADRVETRRINARLATFPRFRVRSVWERHLIQTLLVARQISRDPSVRRTGLKPETHVIEANGHAVKVRVLRPAGPCRGVYLDIHGGGWAIGNARMDDPLNAERVLSCGIATVSVEYRLMPKYTIEAAMDDCETAACWLLDHGKEVFRTDRLLIGGESAGAHLAAVTLLRLRDRIREPLPIAGAVLLLRRL